jgi:lysophospholipase L1-like esterase
LASIIRPVVAVALVLGSLLTFPSAIPAMVAIWVGLHTYFLLRKRPGWIPLVTVVAILLVKNLPWPLPIIVFLVVATALAARSLLAAKPARHTYTHNDRTIAIVGAIVLWLLVGWIAVDWRTASRASSTRLLDQRRSIVCLGDSLTAGGYPLVLRDRFAVPVIDGGQEGITSTDALKFVKSDSFWAQNPQTLVLEIGGHDYNQGGSRSTLAANLRSIIELCRERNVEVVLVETPRGFITDPFGGIERQLAREYDLALVPDTPIRQFVYFGPVIPPGMWLPKSWQLSEDGLHPNALGHRVFADYVERSLVRLYGRNLLQ